ncbi:hypothetical protein VMCG_08357 [Cytospora schulzeri]|uniref:Uncharacterized protein n=1 Tax=Cytospora schulzeri TaxID=448051 RepID=A0A423VVC7_9PEZI|nr:hypothetical protein VMCG_08357 [Valsa malicola]
MPKPSKLLTAATAATGILFLGAASAAPPPPVLEARAPSADSSAAAATHAWVTVDKSGTPVTVTPVVTVDGDGTTTTVSAPPEELTATVVTRTEYAEVTTSTGTAPPGPTATSADGAGSFLVCENAEGLYAPFCQPTQNTSLYPGTTYYVTWDASVFDSADTTVIVEGSYVNTTTNEITSQAFSSPETAAGRSYHAWAVDSGLLRGTANKAVHIALVIRALVADSNSTAAVYPGPTVVVARRRPAYEEPPPRMPTGGALYIGLPAVLGFCVLMIFGVCAWNRKARRIGLGNIMSRRRNGFGGGRGGVKGRVRRRVTARRDRKQAIRLSDHGPETVEVKKGEGLHYRDEEGEGEAPSRQHQSVRYEDDGWGQDWGHQHDEDEEEYRYKDLDEGIHVGVARRDSDALGSLAGTPTSENFPSTQEYKRH